MTKIINMSSVRCILCDLYHGEVCATLWRANLQHAAAKELDEQSNSLQRQSEKLANESQALRRQSEALVRESKALLNTAFLQKIVTESNSPILGLSCETALDVSSVCSGESAPILPLPSVPTSVSTSAPTSVSTSAPTSVPVSPEIHYSKRGRSHPYTTPSVSNEHTDKIISKAKHDFINDNDCCASDFVVTLFGEVDSLPYLPKGTPLELEIMTFKKPQTHINRYNRLLGMNKFKNIAKGLHIFKFPEYHTCGNNGRKHVKYAKDMKNEIILQTKNGFVSSKNIDAVRSLIASYNKHHFRSKPSLTMKEYLAICNTL